MELDSDLTSPSEDEAIDKLAAVSTTLNSDTDTNLNMNNQQHTTVDESGGGVIESALSESLALTRPRRNTKPTERVLAQISKSSANGTSSHTYTDTDTDAERDRSSRRSQRKNMKGEKQDMSSIGTRKRGRNGSKLESIDNGDNDVPNAPIGVIGQADDDLMDLDGPENSLPETVKDESAKTLRSVSQRTIEATGKRKTRTPAEPKGKTKTTPNSSMRTKANSKTKQEKEKPKNPKDTVKTYKLDFVLTNPKSPLVSLNISDIINYQTWTSLSVESQWKISKLLPATAFRSYNGIKAVSEGNDSHQQGLLDGDLGLFVPSGESTPLSGVAGPSAGSSGVKGEDGDKEEIKGEPDLDPRFFLDPHFESAARTFQDHLYTGWMTQKHRDLVRDFRNGISQGTVHAPWKDEVWDRDHPEENAASGDGGGGSVEQEDNGDPTRNIMSRIGTRTSRDTRKDRKSEFDTLVEKGYLKVGDVICIRHKAPSIDGVIEKDALVTSIHPKNYTVTLTSVTGPSQCLPQSTLIPRSMLNNDSTVNDLLPSFDSSLFREMYVSSPAEIVTALLDLDGRLPRAGIPKLLGWHELVLWRWPKSMSTSTGTSPVESSLDDSGQGFSVEEILFSDRGGRERLGTLHYLANTTDV